MREGNRVRGSRLCILGVIQFFVIWVFVQIIKIISQAIKIIIELNYGFVCIQVQAM